MLIYIPDGKASSIALKYVAPAAAKKDAKVGGEKKTSAKDKVAAASQKKDATAGKPEVLRRIPESAPTEAVEVVLRSDGTKGFEIPVTVRSLFPPFPPSRASFPLLPPSLPPPLVRRLLVESQQSFTDAPPHPPTANARTAQTKMYYSPPINGGHDYPVPVTTKMFEVPPVHYQK